MSHKCKEILEEFSSIYLTYLNHLGYKAEIAFYKDYMVKIKLLLHGEGIGFIKAYYSPKKNKTTVSFDELTIDFNPAITFEEFKQQEIYNSKKEKSSNKTNNKANSTEIIEVIKKDISLSYNKSNQYSVYTDGSYKNNNFGYGITILENNQVKAKIAGKVIGNYQGNNVVGEVFGVRRALNYCLNKGIKQLTIYYDLVNLEKWAKNQWKANIPLSQQYKNFIQNINIKIKWQKVKAHSGNKYNELADSLAKEGSAL